MHAAFSSNPFHATLVVDMLGFFQPRPTPPPLPTSPSPPIIPTPRPDRTLPSQKQAPVAPAHTAAPAHPAAPCPLPKSQQDARLSKPGANRAQRTHREGKRQQKIQPRTHLPPPPLHAFPTLAPNPVSRPAPNTLQLTPCSRRSRVPPNGGPKKKRKPPAPVHRYRRRAGLKNELSPAASLSPAPPVSIPVTRVLAARHGGSPRHIMHITAATAAAAP